MSPSTPIRLPRNRRSSRFNRGTEWGRGLVMRAGRSLATYSGFPPRSWLPRAASQEFHRESDKRAGRKHISTRIRPLAVLRAPCTRGKPECQARTWESPEFLLLARPTNETSRHSTKRLRLSATRRRKSRGRDRFRTNARLRAHNFQSVFAQESTTAPKLALGPVVFSGAPPINWQRVSSNPLPTGERLCTAIAVD